MSIPKTANVVEKIRNKRNLTQYIGSVKKKIVAKQPNSIKDIGQLFLVYL